MNFSMHKLLFVATLLYVISFIFIITKKGPLAQLLLIIGLFVNTLYLILRLYISGFLVLEGAFDSVFLTPWAIALILTILYYWYHDQTILYATSVLFIVSFIALSYPKGLLPPSPTKSIFLAHIFFLTESFSIGLFYISGCYSLLYIVSNNSNYFKYVKQCIIWGFIIYSITQFTGAVWCYYGWGLLFKWSPRHLQSVFIWIMYINFIHLKYIAYFDTKGKSLYALLCSLITFIFYLSSYIHEYSIPRIGS